MQQYQMNNYGQNNAVIKVHVHILSETDNIRPIQ